MPIVDAVDSLGRGAGKPHHAELPQAISRRGSAVAELTSFDAQRLELLVLVHLLSNRDSRNVTGYFCHAIP